MVNLTELAGGKINSVPVWIVATPGMCGLCFFLQNSHEDDKPSNISDSRNPTLDKCHAIHNHAYKSYLAVYML